MPDAPRNPLYWQEHPNPWIRRPYVLLTTLPMFFVAIPVVFGWRILRAWVKGFASCAMDFFEDAWEEMADYVSLWWRGLIYCPRIWWQPVDQQDAYARKIQGKDQ